MDPKFFGADRLLPHADLSTVDLETMGSRAADMYLCKQSSLDDAIVKLAKGYPDISKDQVRRVVEFANVETFQHLFEKSANKNVDFDIADPEAVLSKLDEKARPVEKTAMPYEYLRDPVQVGSQNLQDEIAVCEMFGMTPSTDTMEKVAAKKNDSSFGWGATAALPAVAAGTGAGIYGLMQAAKAHKEGLKVLEGLKRGALTGGLTGGAIGLGAAGLIGLGKLLEGADPSGKTLKTAIELAPAAVAVAGAAKDISRDKQFKKKAMVKTAMAAVGSGEDVNSLFEQDLRNGISLGSIEKFAGSKEGYPEAEPFARAAEAKMTLTKMADDLRGAYEKNAFLMHEALGQFSHDLEQSLHQGVNIGEVTHALSAVASPAFVKQALAEVIPDITNRGGFDPAKLQSDAVRYEMEKGASFRVLNTENKMVDTFAGLAKLADGQVELAARTAQVENLLKEATDIVSEASAR